MRQYFQQQYSPHNKALVGAGQIDFELLVRDAERWCGHWDHPQVTRNLTQASPRFGAATLHKPILRCNM